MNTQDGYDWPTPHPVAPDDRWAQAMERDVAMAIDEALSRPRWKCATCADTGVIVDQQLRTDRLCPEPHHDE